jgi:glutathione S-transferase
MFDSPFVRRAAISMQLLDIGYEHADWSVGKDFDRIRQYNPLGRVPTLVLDDGAVLSESAAILDYLDDRVGPARALLPATGPERREALKQIAMAMGAAEKGREQVYERAFRPPDKHHEPWLARCRTQMHGGLAELERYCAARGAQQWLVGTSLGQADITVGCAYTFLREALRPVDLVTRYPRLTALVERCEALPAFKSTHVAFFTPGGQ